MEFKGKLSLPFWVCTVLLAALSAVGWYGVYFLNANEILMEDGDVIPTKIKLLLTVIISIIVLSWTFSFITMLRLASGGCAFIIDESGISKTASMMGVLSLIFVIPISNIPYEAIKEVSEDGGSIFLRIDKSKLDAPPILRPLISSEYRFMYGFTSSKKEEIKGILDRYIK